jgi:hypothetical protein
MNKITVSLNWPNHCELDEVFELEHEEDPVTIAEAINSKQMKINSSIQNISTALMKQNAKWDGSTLFVECR